MNEYWDQMRAHVDAGGRLNHRNGMDLMKRAETAEGLLAELLAVVDTQAYSHANYEEVRERVRAFLQ